MAAPGLAVARGMNEGICSCFVRSARFSSGRGRILIYFELSSKPRLLLYAPQVPQTHSILLAGSILSRASSTQPANFMIESTIFTPSTDNSQSFSSSGSLHCSDPASISPTPCKIAVFPARSHVALWRSQTRSPPGLHRLDRRTPLTGGGLPPVADSDLLAWIPTLLPQIWTWSLTSSMLCSSSICLPSIPPPAAPPFHSFTSLTIPLGRLGPPSPCSSRFRLPPCMPPQPLAAPPGPFFPVSPTHNIPFSFHPLAYSALLA
jgi:hypothetical protein